MLAIVLAATAMRILYAGPDTVCVGDSCSHFMVSQPPYVSMRIRIISRPGPLRIDFSLPTVAPDAGDAGQWWAERWTS